MFEKNNDIINTYSGYLCTKERGLPKYHVDHISSTAIPCPRYRVRHTIGVVLLHSLAGVMSSFCPRPKSAYFLLQTHHMYCTVNNLTISSTNAHLISLLQQFYCFFTVALTHLSKSVAINSLCEVT